MMKTNDARLVRETLCWMRPDARLWLRPDHARFLPPHERKAGFDPEQPRDDEGRWTETGAEEEADGGDDSVGSTLLDEYSDGGRTELMVITT